MTTETDDLLTEIDGPIARITFNRPQARNAITSPMVQKLVTFTEQIAHDDSVRCVVVTGAGDHFMAGGDVAGFGKVLDQTPEERREDFTSRAAASIPIFKNLMTMPKPVIARVRGACAGAAVGFAACCDFVIADDTALFLVAHVHIAASPDGSTTYALTRRVGAAKALEMCMLGGKVSAEEALACGLLNKLVPDGELDTAVEKLAKQLLALPASSLRNIKHLIRSAYHNSMADQLQLEAEMFGDSAADANFIEGVNSFLEKRKPEFNKG
jgi:2-(1,2-epoxy-1,2-dihydrophenyl)acetyl-CoA isomerase